ncbi:MAG: hypothetical protein ACLFMX_01295 [Halobacteriales archaeon]
MHPIVRGRLAEHGIDVTPTRVFWRGDGTPPSEVPPRLSSTLAFDGEAVDAEVAADGSVPHSPHDG